MDKYKRHFWGDVGQFIMIPYQPFEGDVVEISNGYSMQMGDVSQRLKQMSQWEVKELGLYGNGRATVVKEIVHIDFTVLTCISLGGNHIESVEGLPHVHMPYIKQLLLNNNNITSVGVMRKGTGLICRPSQYSTTTSGM